MVGAMLVSVASVGLTTTVASAGTKPAPLVVGAMFPFTGAKAILSTWGTHGVAAGVYAVNAAGGVLGHQLTYTYADDAADPADALPAFRQLMLHHPTFLVGPFSPTIESVINQFVPNNVVDFMVGGLSTLDNNTNPNWFRTSSSDSNEATAMAYFAISHGWKTAVMLFDNSANSQGFVPPLMAAYKALGGTIQSNQVINPGASSYTSTLTSAFQNNPAVVFDSMDSATAATLFHDAQQLGYMNRPWIGDDLQSSSQGPYAAAFGPTVTTNLYAALPATPSGAGYNTFLKDYALRFGKKTTVWPTTYNEYDSIVIASLAMTMANSTNPKVWVKDVVKVSNPPGTACTNYPQCVALLKRHVKINYQGAAGTDDFNKYHNVFSGFQFLGFNSALNTHQVAFVTPAQLAATVAKESKKG
jgi:branched-chain amino acid transport system substrate-binding protein